MTKINDPSHFSLMGLYQTAIYPTYKKKLSYETSLYNI